MTNIKNWIKQELQKGTSSRQIGESLLQHGYTKKQLNQLFIEINDQNNHSNPKNYHNETHHHQKSVNEQQQYVKSLHHKKEPIHLALSLPLAALAILFVGTFFFFSSSSPSVEVLEEGNSDLINAIHNSDRNDPELGSEKMPELQRTTNENIQINNNQKNKESSNSNNANQNNNQNTDDSNDILPGFIAKPYCGDGIINNDEVCDRAASLKTSCTDLGFTGGTLHCTTDCLGYATYDCTSDPVCGNNVVETGEICDGTAVGKETCTTQGFYSGMLKCNPDCTGYDTSACNQKPTVCGNNIVEGNEVCDGTALNSNTCITEGFDSGILGCNNACNGFDTTYCYGDEEQAVCGNNEVEGSEVCDGTFLGLKTCQTQGFDSGTLQCNQDCSGYDTSGCVTDQTCGNNNQEGSETCDGIDLNGETCVSQGFGSGTLACNSNCNSFDTSNCVEASTCGNSQIEGNEVCDSANLNGETCNTQTYYSGTLSCASDCLSFDTSGCTIEVCGNGVKEGNEICDSNDFGDTTCISLGYNGGTPTCGSDCITMDVTSCDGSCGNGVIEPPEVCDGSNLQGATCFLLDWDGGTLSCGSDCKSFDMSGCYDT